MNNTGQFGGVLYNDHIKVSATFIKNTFTRNHAIVGGVLYIIKISELILMQNEFYSNTGPKVSNIYCYADDARILITNNIFEGR